jgi:3,4-dihydroxy 2-butanone 4-phosphate synthase/GTP cyclohydrolase II
MGVLVEILNADGTMARLPQLMDVARDHGLKIISIDDLVAYRMRTERIVRRDLTTNIHTIFGEFEAIAYTDLTSGDSHLVLKKGAWEPGEPVLVRVHSSSETGDILGTLLEDYGTQINNALKSIAKEGRGVFVYLRQNDKGSLLAKLNHYKQLTEEGQVEKFELHSPMGKKDFGVGAQILRDLHISKIRLLTNHPRRRMGLMGYGLEIVENVELT